MTERPITITLQQFANIVLERKGAQIVTLTTATEPRLKRSNPFGPITKISVVNGVINFNYQNAVNKQREREDKETDFVSQPRTWGQKIAHTPFIEHNGKYYLTIKVEKTQSPTYVDSNGHEINVSDLIPHMYAQSESSRQDVEKEIITRDYCMSNVTMVTMNSVTYQIVNRGELHISPLS